MGSRRRLAVTWQALVLVGCTGGPVSDFPGDSLPDDPAHVGGGRQLDASTGEGASNGGSMPDPSSPGGEDSAGTNGGGFTPAEDAGTAGPGFDASLPADGGVVDAGDAGSADDGGAGDAGPLDGRAGDAGVGDASL